VEGERGRADRRVFGPSGNCRFFIIISLRYFSLWRLRGFDCIQLGNFEREMFDSEKLSLTFRRPSFATPLPTSIISRPFLPSFLRCQPLLLNLPGAPSQGSLLPNEDPSILLHILLFHHRTRTHILSLIQHRAQLLPPPDLLLLLLSSSPPTSIPSLPHFHQTARLKSLHSSSSQNFLSWTLFRISSTILLLLSYLLLPFYLLLLLG